MQHPSVSINRSHNHYMRLLIISFALMILLINFSGIYAQAESAYISTIDWSPDGSKIVLGYDYAVPQSCVPDHFVRTIDVNNGQILRQFKDTCAVRGMGFNPVGGNLLIITSASMQHWNPVTQEKVFEIIYEDSLIDGGWNPSGTQFIVLNGGFANAFGSDGLVIDLHRLGVDSLHLSFSSFDWNWDGSSIVLGLDNGAIYVWNIAKETVSTVFTGHNFKVDTISHNPFNNLVASGDDNGTLLIWNPDTGRIIWTLTGHTSAVNDLAWSPDGRGLASASTDGTVIVWDVITGKPITTFDYGAPVRAVAWSPKGGQIVFGGDALPGTTPEPRFETVPDSTFSPALPLPNAGDDQTITGDGRSALVTLDGLNSIDVDGAVTSYIWVEAGSIIATGAQPQVKLSVGTHTITLTVSDNDHQLASDEVIISVFPTAVPSPSSTP